MIQRGIARLALKALGSQAIHPNQGSWSFLLPGTNIDYVDKLGSGLDSNVLVAPILYVARNFSQSRLAVAADKDGKRVLDTRHPMAQLVRRPNPFYSGTHLWMATLLSWFLDGNSYWHKVRGSKGQVAELWYLPHWLVEPKWDKTKKGYVDYYRYNAGGEVKEFKPADVVHLRYGIDPDNVRKGYGMLKPVAREAYGDSEAMNLIAAVLKNKGVLGLVISPDGESEFDDIEATKKYLKEKATGDHRGEPYVFSRSVKIQEFGFNPQELDLGTVHNLSEERICAMIGLPAAVVGFGTGLETTKVGATMQEFRRLAWTDCIIPTQDALAEDLTRALLPEFEESGVAEVDWDRTRVTALEDNANQRAERLDKLFRGSIIMRSEAREELGKESTDADKVYAVPLGVMLVDEDGNEVGAPDEPPPAAPLAPGAPAAGQEPPKGLKRITGAQVRILRAMNRIEAKHRKAMQRRLTKFLKKLGADVERAYLNIAKASPEDELRVHQLMEEVEFEAREAEYTALMQSEYLAIYKSAREVGLSMGLVMDAEDPGQIEILRLGGTRKLDLADAGRERALEILADAREEGLGVDEVARRLRDAVPAGTWTSPEIRAEVVARTETRYAQTRSALEVYRGAEGIDQVMMLDNRLGPQPGEDVDMEGNACAEVNGRVVSFEEAQHLLDVEHPNGTRDIVPVFGGT